MALDDPEGWQIYNEIVEASASDPLIHVFTNLIGVGNIEVNAFQRLSDVVVQKSIREGFGLVVSEALWKQTPVVAGRAGGIPLQMADGAGGLLVDGVDECAAALVELLGDAAQAKELAQLGHERVRAHFLLPRLLLNDLSLMLELQKERRITTTPLPPEVRRDPVCGMAIEEAAAAAFVATVDGRGYAFCSEQCRARFLLNPARYGAEPASERQ
jgi:trehalose synthase